MLTITPIANISAGAQRVAATPQNVAPSSNSAANVATTSATANVPVVQDTNSSTSFLAQLYSQQPQAIAVATADDHFTPAPAYNAFVEFGFVKYAPSDAGIPSSAASVPKTASAPTEYKAYSNTSSRNQSQLAPKVTSHIAIAG